MIAIWEDVGIEHIYARYMLLVREVDEPDFLPEAGRSELKQRVYEVGVRVHHNDRFVVLSQRLLFELVRHAMLDKSGLAHAGPRDDELVLAQHFI